MQNAIRCRVASDKDIMTISRIEFQDILLEAKEDDHINQERLSKIKREASKKRKAEKAQSSSSKDKEWSKQSKSKARRANLVCNYCKKKGLPEKVFSTHVEQHCRIKKRDARDGTSSASSRKASSELENVKKDHKKAMRKITKAKKEMKKELQAFRAFLKSGDSKQKKAFKKFSKDYGKKKKHTGSDNESSSDSDSSSDSNSSDSDSDSEISNE